MNIEVKFDGEEIIVTKPGTDFMLAYRKRPESQTLKLTRSWVNPHTTSPAVNEFRAQAFQVAVSKSRELGWIAWVSRSLQPRPKRSWFPRGPSASKWFLVILSAAHAAQPSLRPKA